MWPLFFSFTPFNQQILVKIYPLKGLEHKNKGHMNFYKRCDLTKKYIYRSPIKICNFFPIQTFSVSVSGTQSYIGWLLRIKPNSRASHVKYRHIIIDTERAKNPIKNKILEFELAHSTWIDNFFLSSMPLDIIYCSIFPFLIHFLKPTL